MRAEVWGLGLWLAVMAGPVLADTPPATPDAEMLEFLGRFGADDEALDLALASVADETGTDERRGSKPPATAEENDDESR